VAAVHELQEEPGRAAAAGLEPTGDPALGQAVATELLAGHDAMVDALLRVTRGLAASLQAPAAASSARLLLAVAAASPPPSACPPGWSRPGCRCRPDRT
jgi:hypothetical protein